MPHKLKATASPLVIVISPLISLMEAHVAEATSLGLCAFKCPDTNLSLPEADLLLGSPEFWTSKDGSTLLKQIAKDVILLVTDEVHVTPKWGVGKKDLKAFRVAFSKLGQIRSHLPCVPVLALTATATTKTRNHFQKQLAMKDPLVVARTPDRPNIKLTVQKVHDLSFLSPLIDLLRADGRACPRTVIYCKTKKDCVDVFCHLDTVLGKHGYIASDGTSSMRLFAMYFHDTLPGKKDAILKDLLSESGHFRVVVATNALGMGIDMKGVNSIYHYGVPRDLEDYLQEIGRAGRSGEPASASLFFKAIQAVGSSLEMKEYVRNIDSCRRALLLKHFGSTFTEVKGCLCCDICTQQCDCDKVHEPTQTDIEPDRVVREVSDEDIELLRDILSELQQSYVNQFHAFGIPVWSPSLTESIIQHVSKIDSVKYIAFNLPVIDSGLTVKIFQAVCEVFDEDFVFSDEDSNYVTLCDEIIDSDNSFMAQLLSSVELEDLEPVTFECADALDEDVDLENS